MLPRSRIPPLGRFGLATRMNDGLPPAKVWHVPLAQSARFSNVATVALCEYPRTTYGPAGGVPVCVVPVVGSVNTQLDDPFRQASRFCCPSATDRSNVVVPAMGKNCSGVTIPTAG